MDSINIAGDSSIALTPEAEAPGYALFHYDVTTLTLDADDRLFAMAHPVRVRREADNPSPSERLRAFHRPSG